MNTRTSSLLSLAFKAIALAMAVVCIVISMLNIATPSLYVILLSMGLFCLAIAAISDRPDR